MTIQNHPLHLPPCPNFRYFRTGGPCNLIKELFIERSYWEGCQAYWRYCFHQEFYHEGKGTSYYFDQLEGSQYNSNHMVCLQLSFQKYLCNASSDIELTRSHSRCEKRCHDGSYIVVTECEHDQWNQIDKMMIQIYYHYLMPASRTRTIVSEFSVNRPANASPAVPATLEICEHLQDVVRDRQD